MHFRGGWVGRFYLPAIAPWTMMLAALLAMAPAARAQLQPVTMAMPSEGLAYSLSYIADAKGLWAKHGIDMHEVLIAASARPMR